MRDLQARLGFLVILHLPGNIKCTPSTALDDFFRVSCIVWLDGPRATKQQA
jgi:hypothetical protein